MEINEQEFIEKFERWYSVLNNQFIQFKKAGNDAEAACIVTRMIGMKDVIIMMGYTVDVSTEKFDVFDNLMNHVVRLPGVPTNVHR